MKVHSHCVRHVEGRVERRFSRFSRFFRLFHFVIIVIIIILVENIAIVIANLCGMSLLLRSSLDVRA
jgi:hypothetical protein